MANKTTGVYYQHINDFDHVRAETVCMGCYGRKLRGPVICAKCHQDQMARNTGKYSHSMTKTLIERDRDLRKGLAKRAMAQQNFVALGAETGENAAV